MIAFVPAGEETAVIADDLRTLAEVTAVDQSRLSRLTLAAVNNTAADTFLDAHQAAIREAGIIGMMTSIEGRDLAHPLPDKHLQSGRMLTAADIGQPVAIISSLIAETIPLDVGSTVTFTPEDGEPFTLEIVGIYREMGWSVGGTGFLTSIETIAAADSQAGSVLRIKANPEIEDSSAEITQIINQRYLMLFVLESQELLFSFTSLLDTLSVFPTLVAFLSLFAGAVIVANNVILALLDRRSEIGILKAVGIRRGKVLALLLLENGLFGFIGCALGLLLASLAAYLVTSQGLLGESVDPVFNGVTITAVLTGGLLIVFLTTILATWSTVQARPLAVLRNE
jgi:putative ABC transport system permease protein